MTAPRLLDCPAAGGNGARRDEGCSMIAADVAAVMAERRFRWSGESELQAAESGETFLEDRPFHGLSEAAG